MDIVSHKNYLQLTEFKPKTLRKNTLKIQTFSAKSTLGDCPKSYTTYVFIKFILYFSHVLRKILPPITIIN